jgi:type VI secretion system protein ImpJ
MTADAVHWYEGLFLRPQHFQTAHRQFVSQLQRSARWDVHFNWGIRVLELDVDALANYRLVVRRLQARLRDGTLVCSPEDGVLPAVDLKPAFETSKALTVYLAVPVLNLRKANAAERGTADGSVRYLVDQLEIEDENTGVDALAVYVRRLNFRLLLSTQDHAGFEVLPIARIEKSPQAEAVPQLDRTYVPPLLACDASKPLLADVLQPIYDRLGKKTELLASQVVSRGITFDSHSQGDALIFAQLRELNEALAVFGVEAFIPGIHPLALYLELCRLVGQLSIFGGTRRPPELPQYDHDDLGTCFYRVKQHIDDLLNIFVEPEYKERPFIGAGMRMQVALEPAWLESVWQLYIGVRSELDANECIRLLTKPGELDMKVGSSDRVDPIFRLGLAGLRISYAGRPPRALPALPGLIYFQVARESQQDEWQNVQRSLTLAIRLNENLIAGNIQGQQVLTIKTAGKTATMQFSLYVVPRDAQ